MSRDQKFFDMYSLIIGILVAVALALVVLAMKMSDLTQGIYTRDTEEYRQAVAERIRPIGDVYRPGEAHDEPARSITAAPEPEPVAAALSGPQVYNSACIACHAAGVGGAPIVGDAAAWEARIAQGMATLTKHAIEGFTGAVGYMPAKGGRMDLSDDEITAAVEYMAAESQ